MKTSSVVLTAAWVIGTGMPLFAQDHANLDENRPVRVEDPYPLAHGEFALESGFGFVSRRGSSDKGLFSAEALYGLAPNLHVSLGSTFFSNPGEPMGEQRSGDLRVAGLYNFNRESMDIPGFGIKLTGDFPTGVESEGTAIELKGIVTKSIDRLSFHLNGAFIALQGEDDAERPRRYEVVLGASYPLGAPLSPWNTVIVDLYVERSALKLEDNTYGVEVGVRHQWGTQTVIDAGVGSEVEGPDDRARFFLTVGLSLAL